MLYKKLEKAKNVVNAKTVDEFDFWLATIPISIQNNITISLVAKRLNAKITEAKALLEYAEKEKILESHYIVVCPNDKCKAVINNNVSLPELHDIIGEKKYCHICKKENIVAPNNIFISYKRIKRPDVPDQDIQKAIEKHIKKL